MDNPEFQQHGGLHTADHRPHRKPIHHSPFFWVAAFFILVAMIVYVFSENLAFGPTRKPVPAALP